MILSRKRNLMGLDMLKLGTVFANIATSSLAYPAPIFIDKYESEVDRWLLCAYSIFLRLIHAYMSDETGKYSLKNNLSTHGEVMGLKYGIIAYELIIPTKLKEMLCPPCVSDFNYTAIIWVCLDAIKRDVSVVPFP